MANKPKPFCHPVITYCINKGCDIGDLNSLLKVTQDTSDREQYGDLPVLGQCTKVHKPGQTLFFLASTIISSLRKQSKLLFRTHSTDWTARSGARDFSCSEVLPFCIIFHGVRTPFFPPPCISSPPLPLQIWKISDLKSMFSLLLEINRILASLALPSALLVKAFVLPA